MSSVQLPGIRKQMNIMKAGIAATLLIGTGAFYFGIEQQYSTARCLSDVDQQQHAREEQAASDRPARLTGAGEKPDPSKAYQAHHDRYVAGDPRGAACFWPGQKADLVIARASLNFSFIGYLAAILFGTVGVLGIYLSFSLAVDAARAGRGGGT
jgi:hypothetical protein